MFNSVIRLRWLSVIVLVAAIIAFGTDESPVALNKTKANAQPNDHDNSSSDDTSSDDTSSDNSANVSSYQFDAKPEKNKSGLLSM